MKAVYQVVNKPLTDFHRLIDGVWRVASLPIGSYIYDEDINAPQRNVGGFELMLERGRIVDVSSKQIVVQSGDYSKIGNVFESEKDMVDISNKKMQSANKKGGKKKDDVEEVEDINQDAQDVQQDIEEEVN